MCWSCEAEAMDSDCCEICGCLLSFDEAENSGICEDCLDEEERERNVGAIG